MHAVVLLKQILDWELPPRKFAIDPVSKAPAAELGPLLLGPFEQNALELTLQLKDAGVLERVSVLLAGGEEGTEALRKALAVRADDAVLVEHAPTGPHDPAQTAELLARAIERLGSPELVVAGRQAGDWDHGQVPYLVAERLGRPAVGLAWHAEWQDGGRLLVWRNGVDGVEKLSVRPPVVLTVTNHESLLLRMSSVIDLMAANRKTIERWTPEELGMDDLEGARRLVFEKVWVPEVESACEFVEGDDPAEAAALLVDRMLDLKLLGTAS